MMRPNTIRWSILGPAAHVVLLGIATAQGPFRIIPAAPGFVDPAGLLSFHDHDNDGDLDHHSGFAYHEYDRSGMFRPAPRIASTIGMSIYLPALGDVNGDGHTDILAGGFRAAAQLAPPILFLGDGAGGFVEAANRFHPASLWHYSNTFALVDVDGDGDLDAIAPHGHTFVTVGLNDGSGTFTVDPAATHPPSPWAGLASFEKFDANGDGLEDLFLISLPPKLAVNDGQGSFHISSPFGVTQQFWPTIADADMDGDLDVALFSTNLVPLGLPPAMFFNDGNGNFTRDDSGIPTQSPRFRGAFADVDGDGDPDLITVFERSVPSTTRPGLFKPLELWINDGTGNFAIAPEDRMPLVADPAFRVKGFIHSGDIDGDGDVDLGLMWVSDSVHPTRSFVAWNFERHLYTDKSIRTNQSGERVYDIHLHAPAGHAVSLFAGFARAHVQLPGHGILSFDPALSIATPATVMPASGQLTIEIPVPTNPVFQGIPVHWQAVDIDLTDPASFKLMAGYSWDSVL